MFAVNLKSLIYLDTFRLTKNISCSVFRSNLRENVQIRSISRRSLSSKLLRNADQRQLLTPKTPNVNPQRQASKSPISMAPLTMKRVLVVIGIGSAFLLLFNYLKREKLKRIEAHKNKEIGKVKLGGTFELIDQNNKAVTSEDLLGNWLLIYFGFTHCPDICPDELEKMVAVVDALDNVKGEKGVKPIFITVDPERDTPGVIKKYLKEFSEKIIGLTGTVEQIAKVCKAYRVYFSPGPKDSDADYIVDHSIIMYLVDPNGKFVDYYGQNINAESIVTSIRYNQLKHSPAKSLLQKAKDIFNKE